MRRSLMFASMLLAVPAMAQEEPADAPAPAAEEAPAEAAGSVTEEPAAAARPAEPVIRAPTSKPTPPPSAPAGTDPALLDAVARFFGALREGDASGIAAVSSAPFRLEAEELK